MATTTLDASLLELVDTLDLAKVPDKLHCPKCKQFLLNAYKGICCDSTVCEPCYQRTNNACPTCQQSPYSVESGICKPNTNVRRTVKIWLKNQAKVRVAGGDPAKSPAGPPAMVNESFQPAAPTAESEVGADVADTEGPSQPVAEDLDLLDAVHEESQEPPENPEENAEPHSDPTDGGEDEVEIQVEPSQEDEQYMSQHMMEPEEADPQSAAETQQVAETVSRPNSPGKEESPIRSANFDMTNNMDFNNSSMDFNQMMQQMFPNGMGFNPMMGLPMGMNPMANMFGGFSGPNGGMNGMNGMNMGMNFNANMFGAFQNGNMWQNSNPNAFSNGMGGDFNYGLNFNQQQNYANGDFQSGYYGRGYGRGRGRGRGGYSRGRGNFYQYQNQNHPNNFQNTNEQQQFEQSQMAYRDRRSSRQEPVPEPKQEEPHPDDDEFAPGGQEDVQEALGDDYVKKEASTAETHAGDAVDASSAETHTGDVAEAAADHAGADEMKSQEQNNATPEPNGIENPSENETLHVQSLEVARPEEERKPIAEAYDEDLDLAMPPPSAPSGPSGRYGEKDYGFRARGHGRFSRSRGSIHLTNGHPPSPVRSTSSSTLPRPESAGGGVVGAPTGPRAMREPPPKPSPRSSTSGGFQIMGRASMASSRLSERDRSPTPNGHDEHKEFDRSSSRGQFSRRNERSGDRYEDKQDNYDRDRRYHKSRRDDLADQDMQDADYAHSRSNSRDQNKSHKSRRDREKDKDANNSKHPSRRYREDGADDDYDMNDYGEAVDESGGKTRSHRKHRDERSSRDRERERERDRDRDRERPRDKDRKRSRHDRDYEDEDDSERRHRSKHHKKEHPKELEINGRSNSHWSSQATTPTAAPKEAEKDPYTLEREARQRERMLKEDQRREKAASAKAGGLNRRVSYKTEEDAQRGMEERESAMRAARWR